MKTVKTATGMRTIQGDDKYFVSLQLRSILQDHRTHLISNLIKSDLNRYIDYKFDRMANPILLSQIRSRLTELKQSGVNMLRYHSVLESVQRYGYVQLENELFFAEIDDVIRQSFHQTELFQMEPATVYYSRQS